MHRVGGGLQPCDRAPAQCGTDERRARLPPLPLERARRARGAAGRSPARPRARAIAAAAGHRADPAGGDAALAAGDAGRPPRHRRQHRLPHPGRIRRPRAGREPRQGRGRTRRRRPALAAVRRACRCPADGTAGDGDARRLSPRRRRGAALGARGRTRRGVREIPGLAARLAAALGRRRRPRRSAGDPVARGRGRPRTSRTADPGLPRALRRRRRAARRPAGAAVRLRHPQHLARRAARARHPGARRHPAFLPAHPEPRVLGRPAIARRALARGRGSVRRRCRREPAAARLGRGGPRFHGPARQLRGGASLGRVRRLHRSAGQPARRSPGLDAAEPAAPPAGRPVPSPRDAGRAVARRGPGRRRQPAVPRLPYPAARTAGAARPPARAARGHALRPAAAAARDRGAGPGHRSLRAVPGCGVRRAGRTPSDSLRAGRRESARRRTAGRRVPAPARAAAVALRAGGDPRPAGQPAAGRGQRPAGRRHRTPARLAARGRRPLGAGCRAPRATGRARRRWLDLAIRAGSPAAGACQRRRGRGRRRGRSPGRAVGRAGRQRAGRARPPAAPAARTGAAGTRARRGDAAGALARGAAGHARTGAAGAAGDRAGPARAGPPARPGRWLRASRTARGLRGCGAARGGARAFRRGAGRGRHPRPVAHRRGQLRADGADAPAAVPCDLPARHERWRLPAPRSRRRAESPHRRAGHAGAAPWRSLDARRRPLPVPAAVRLRAGRVPRQLARRRSTRWQCARALGAGLGIAGRRGRAARRSGSGRTAHRRTVGIEASAAAVLAGRVRQRGRAPLQLPRAVASGRRALVGRAQRAGAVERCRARTRRAGRRGGLAVAGCLAPLPAGAGRAFPARAPAAAPARRRRRR